MTVTARPVDRAKIKRPGIVYACDVLDHKTGKIMPMDYIGQSRRKLKTREAEHRDCQPWSDLIKGSFYVIARGMWDDDELDEQERAAIARHRPRLNYKENLDNPDRIPKWDQRDQRWERDDAEGQPRWVHPDDRVPVVDPVVVSVPADAVGPVTLWKPWQIAAGIWLAVWVALSSLVWVLLGLALHSDAEVWASCVAVAAGSLGTAEVARRWYRRGPRPRRRRASRR